MAIINTITPSPVVLQQNQQNDESGFEIAEDIVDVVIPKPAEESQSTFELNNSPDTNAPAQESTTGIVESRLQVNNSHIYPLDLGQVGQEPFMIFDIRKWEKKMGDSLGVIGLYMPPSLKASYKAMYSEIKDLDKWLTAQGQEAFRSGSKLFSGEKGSLADLASQVGLAGAQVMGDSTAGAQLEFQLKKLLNPQMTQAFNGMSFRSFQFDYQLMAKSPAESEAINNIIYAFKYYMHPGIDGAFDDTSVYLEYPEVFIIKLFSPETKYLFRTDRCVLTDVDVDYAGSGVPSFFNRTGAPVDVRLTLRFVEMTHLTKQDIAKGY